MKSVRIRSFLVHISSIYRVNLRIQLKRGKIRARKNFEYGHISRSGIWKYDIVTAMHAKSIKTEENEIHYKIT